MTRPYKANRESASGTVKKTLDAIAQGFPEPPVKLLPRERPYWDAVVRARLPQQWCEFDLHSAVLLTRALCDLERHREFLLDEGEIDLNNKINPRSVIVDRLVARVANVTRLLQLHAVAKLDQASELGASKAEAQRVAAALGRGDEDDLFASPKMH